MLQTSCLKLIFFSLIITSFSACGLLNKTNKTEDVKVVEEIEEQKVEEEVKVEAPKLVIPKLIQMSTSMGDITVQLYEGTPQHQENFAKLIDKNYYDGLLFHRVIKDFMVQAGDPNSKNAPKGTRLGNGGPNYTVPAEITQEYFHKKGALCAARQGDNVNPEKRSSGSQFYFVTGAVYSEGDLKQMEDRINMQAKAGLTPEELAKYEPYQFTEEQIKIYTTEGGTPFLDNGYTVFGEIVDGMDIIEKIGGVTTIGERPMEDVKIIGVKILE